jgi:ABC-type bacteriocin/lantibiotic exporter with double-glycine peptidase domain
MNHVFQPTGHSCGPTCLKMVADHLSIASPSVEQLCTDCGTDWQVGTPPERMVRGLKKLLIPYTIHQLEEAPFAALRMAVDLGAVCILRTLTHQVPHWIIVYDYTDKSFVVNDPWLGPMEYSEEELRAIWEVRDYFYFKIQRTEGGYLAGAGPLPDSSPN